MGLTNSKQNLSTLNWKLYNTENYESKINLNDNNVKWIIKNYGGESNKSELSTTTTSLFISHKFLEGGNRKINTSTTNTNKFKKSSNISNKSSETNNMYNYTSSNISNSISITENLNLKKDLSSSNENSSENFSANSSMNSNNSSNTTLSASNSTLETNDLNIISHPTTAH